ncbi:uncharacterized protein METZ01_LOCUS347395, partial [marine metagenome]
DISADLKVCGQEDVEALQGSRANPIPSRLSLSVSHQPRRISVRVHDTFSTYDLSGQPPLQ